MRLGRLLLALAMSIGIATATYGQAPPEGLTPELAGRLAKLMKRDWKQPPEWAEEMVALLEGGGMGMGQGWFRPSESRYDWAWLKKHFDANGDDQLKREEFPKLDACDLYFARLDSNRDGVITADDFRTPRPSEEAQLADELFYRLDVDSNGRLTSAELEGFFAKADREGRGFITPDDVTLALKPQPQTDSQPPSSPRRRPTPADMIAMLMKGELGSLGEGPKLNAKAPPFKLRTFDNATEVSLSSLLAKKKPVVLIFGSFT